MATSSGKILSLFKEPDRTSSLRAVSLFLLRVRAHGHTCADLAKIAECSADTIANATNEQTLLSFDALARLGFRFHEEFKLVETLWNCGPVDEPTIAERLDRIVREVELVRKALPA